MTTTHEVQESRKQPKPVRRPKELRPLRLVNGRLEGPELPTLAEVAALFNVRRETIWSWRENKDFPAGVRVGTLVRFPREKVEEWISKHAVA